MSFDPWEEHTTYTRADWKAEVAANDTLRGYWDWVNSQAEAAGEPIPHQDQTMIKGRLGKVVGPRELIIRFCVGTARSESSNEEFELAHSTDISPLVECKRTQKTYTLPWSDIIDMAVQAGITKEDSDG